VKEVKNFPSGDDLHELPLHAWGNGFFTSLNSKLNIDDFFKPMAER